MSKTGDTIAAATLISHLDTAKQNKELEAVSSTLRQLQSAQLSEAARRVAIEQVREQIVSLNAQQRKASRVLESDKPEVVEAAAYLILDVKETLGTVSTSMLPDIQDKEYLLALQSRNTELLAKLNEVLGNEKIQELEKKVFAGNIYGEIAAHACASGTLAQNRTPPLSWLFWWNSHLRHRLDQFGRIGAQDIAQTGTISTGTLIGGYIFLLARFTIFPFIPALLIALIYGSLFGGRWREGGDTALLTFKLWPVFAFGIPMASLIYRRVRSGAIREWATQTDIDPNNWFNVVRRISPKALKQELKENQSALATSLSRIGIEWPSGLQPGTQAEADFLNRARVAVKQLAGYE